MTALGSQPLITALDPYTATMGAPAFTLMVEGSGYISGSQVLWNGTALPTTFVDGSHLTAAVDAAQVAAAGVVSVTVQGPVGGFTSNTALFVVAAPLPVINSVSPGSVMAGSAGSTLTVSGSGFSAGAQVLWNGDPLPTEVLSATQLRAQLPAALLVNGQTAGIAVRNGPPDGSISAAVPFEVQMARPLYLPLVKR